MSETKYDGWVIRSFWVVPNFLMMDTFGTTRAEAISRYEQDARGIYTRYRKQGKVKAVKVRIFQVFEGE